MIKLSANKEMNLNVADGVASVNITDSNTDRGQITNLTINETAGTTGNAVAFNQTAKAGNNVTSSMNHEVRKNGTVQTKFVNSVGESSITIDVDPDTADWVISINGVPQFRLAPTGEKAEVV